MLYCFVIVSVLNKVVLLCHCVGISWAMLYCFVTVSVLSDVVLLCHRVNIEQCCTVLSLCQYWVGLCLYCGTVSTEHGCTALSLCQYSIIEWACAQWILNCQYWTMLYCFVTVSVLSNVVLLCHCVSTDSLGHWSNLIMISVKFYMLAKTIQSLNILQLAGSFNVKR